MLQPAGSQWGWKDYHTWNSDQRNQDISWLFRFLLVFKWEIAGHPAQARWAFLDTIWPWNPNELKHSKCLGYVPKWILFGMRSVGRIILCILENSQKISDQFTACNFHYFSQCSVPWSLPNSEAKVLWPHQRGRRSRLGENRDGSPESPGSFRGCHETRGNLQWWYEKEARCRQGLDMAHGYTVLYRTYLLQLKSLFSQWDYSKIGWL